MANAIIISTVCMLHCASLPTSDKACAAQVCPGSHSRTRAAVLPRSLYVNCHASTFVLVASPLVLQPSKIFNVRTP